MRKTLAFIALFLFANSSFSQENFKPDEKYMIHSSRANGYYAEKKYALSGSSFDSLFILYKGTGLRVDKYNAACSWALAGNKDKAFHYLNEVVVKDKWSFLSHTMTDSDLQSLHSDGRWDPLMKMVKVNEDSVNANLNKPLVAILDTIYRKDQDERMKINLLEKKYGFDSPQLDSLWKIIHDNDSLNQIKVKSIIEKHGWVGPDEVGQQGASTIFLVIQHSDSLTQATYLPLMREAVEKGKASASNLALLEDRVLTSQGKKQLYGSQLRRNQTTGKLEFFPIEDEPNVNARRAKMGLGRLEDYAKFFGLEYTVPKK